MVLLLNGNNVDWGVVVVFIVDGVDIWVDFNLFELFGYIGSMVVDFCGFVLYCDSVFNVMLIIFVLDVEILDGLMIYEILVEIVLFQDNCVGNIDVGVV